MMAALLLLLGVVLLVAGAEALVRGASRLAAAVGISPLVIGLTVVAYGTSAPELAVSVKASLSGQPDIAMGNVIGSNICNVLLILGLSATVAPLVVNQSLVRKDVPIMLGVSVLLLFASMNGVLQRWEGLALVAGGLLYTAFAIHQSHKESKAVVAEYQREFAGPRRQGAIQIVTNVALIAIGLVTLVVGARFLVSAAVDIARVLGVSERVIGLTIVAVGTSLPELATSVVAAARGQRDIAVGNVVGSNIFNILFVLGISSVVGSGGIRVSPSLLRFDIPVMIAVAATCLPVFLAGHQIRRAEGVILLGYFVAYTAYLIMADRQSPALGSFTQAMLVFVLPLTAVALAFSTVQAVRRGDHRHPARRGVVRDAPPLPDVRSRRDEP